MFKNKFKELVQNKKELAEVSFEILNDKQASELSGGCRVLSSCGVFDGTCPNLKTCQRFHEPEVFSAE
jgi:hypothetical protein